jgi:hypothetical protein
MTHQERYKEYYSKRDVERVERRKEGKCLLCERPHRPKRTTCQICADRYAKWQREKRIYRSVKERGINWKNSEI